MSFNLLEIFQNKYYHFQVSKMLLKKIKWSIYDRIEFKTRIYSLASPGVLQLAQKCRVYNMKYIKCVIRAPTIARAIQNDYPAKFRFTELTHP